MRITLCDNCKAEGAFSEMERSVPDCILRQIEVPDFPHQILVRFKMQVRVFVSSCGFRGERELHLCAKCADILLAQLTKPNENKNSTPV